jgi:hypothetical protein
MAPDQPMRWWRSLGFRRAEPYRRSSHLGSPVFKPIFARGAPHGALAAPPPYPAIPVFKPNPVEGNHVPLGATMSCAGFPT